MCTKFAKVPVNPSQITPVSANFWPSFSLSLPTTASAPPPSSTRPVIGNTNTLANLFPPRPPDFLPFFVRRHHHLHHPSLPLPLNAKCPAQPVRRPAHLQRTPPQMFASWKLLAVKRVLLLPTCPPGTRLLGCHAATAHRRSCSLDLTHRARVLLPAPPLLLHRLRLRLRLLRWLLPRHCLPLPPSNRMPLSLLALRRR